MRKILKTFGDGWFEVTPSKMTIEERDILLDTKASEEDRDRIKSSILSRSSRRASSEDALMAERIILPYSRCALKCATVVLPLEHGFVVHSGGWVSF